MTKVFVLVEHRRGEVRESTFECITLAKEFAEKNGVGVAAVLLAADSKPLLVEVATRVPETIVIEHPELEPFRYETYTAVLRDLIETEAPILVLAPHSAFGMELLPRLSVELSRPCVTDCLSLGIEEGKLIAKRSIYSGKIEERVTLAKAKGYFSTLRSGCYSPAPRGEREGGIVKYPCPALPTDWKTEHRGYRETASGEVDISQAQFLLAIGRGIKDAENLPRIQALAEKLGAVLACSRPVVDKKWLGKERQVGTSGRTVKPKVYLALGISGAFQHLAGIKGTSVFIAVNRDPRAPIFRAADYGVTEDLFKIVSALEEKLC